MDISKAIRGAQPLYFEAAWLYVFGNNAGQGGKSYSPAFAVVDISNTPDFLDAGEITELFVNDPYFPEEAAGGGGDGSDADGGNGSGSSTTDSAPKTTPTANDGKDGTAVVSGNSGPPVAAIVGGVVGGVLGLLLIACLIWFLLRKKRQQRDPALAAHPYAGVSRTRTDELMAEKEANLASSSHAAAAAGPGSPYSDAGAPDDQQARAVHHRSSLSAGAAAPLIPAAAAAAAVVSPTTPADVPPGYTPYTDRPASGAGTTEEPPAAAGGVASMLVEEGMTAEEIRRLEEEERAIDAAIERAVRRPTG
ncbi:hypothetical protein QBC39DRAFT_377118 [Podospora conica]|nr:hypothetical protein QBC39DRAFT_377118 [Schizothecium conicum]